MLLRSNCRAAKTAAKHEPARFGRNSKQKAPYATSLKGGSGVRRQGRMTTGMSPPKRYMDDEMDTSCVSGVTVRHY